VPVAVAGGVRVPEPGGDLAVALAVASSALGRPLPADLVACGEVGLGGELRQVHRTERRLAEAARLGFTRAVVPRSAPDPPGGMRVARSPSIGDALRVTRVVPAAQSEVDPRGDSAHSRTPEATAHAER
jgi:DNA repair protein RadA/Sms